MRIRGDCAEAAKLCTCLRELEMAGAVDKSQADFLISLVNVISDKLWRARDERDRAVDLQNAGGIDFSRLQATCIKSDGICWQCERLRQLIDALVWDKGEYLNHAGQWTPTGTLTCHFCGAVKGHPHSEKCRAKGIE